MPVEFNLSHEETVNGWDKIINQCFLNVNKFKDSISISFDYGDNLESFSINYINQEIHHLIHQIINIQEMNLDLNNTIDHLFKTIIENCVLGLCFLKDDFLLPIFDPKYCWDEQIHINRELMINKNKNYGSSWSIMRPGSITDVIHTKIHRIISLLEGTENKFESIKDSFEDILNYCVFCIMRMNLAKEKK